MSRSARDRRGATCCALTPAARRMMASSETRLGDPHERRASYHDLLQRPADGRPARRYRRVGALSRRPAHLQPQLQVPPAARPAVRCRPLSQLLGQRGRHAERPRLHRAGPPGMQVRHQNASPSLERDWLAVAERFDWLMPVGFYYKTFTHPTAWRFVEPLIRRVAGLGEVADHPPAASRRCTGLRAPLPPYRRSGYRWRPRRNRRRHRSRAAGSPRHAR